MEPLILAHAGKGLARRWRGLNPRVRSLGPGASRARGGVSRCLPRGDAARPPVASCPRALLGQIFSRHPDSDFQTYLSEKTYAPRGRHVSLRLWHPPAPVPRSGMELQPRSEPWRGGAKGSASNPSGKPGASERPPSCGKGWVTSEGIGCLRRRLVRRPKVSARGPMAEQDDRRAPVHPAAVGARRRVPIPEGGSHIPSRNWRAPTTRAASCAVTLGPRRRRASLQFGMLASMSRAERACSPSGASWR